jgi:hypothetical protein
MTISEKVKEKLPQIKKLLFGEDTPEEQATEGKLKDGTLIKWSGELKEGTQITVVTAEGDMPAPDGDHILEDGTTLSVAEGKVTKIEKPKEEEAPAAPDFSAQIAEAKDAAQAAFSKVEELSKQVKALSDKLETAQAFNKQIFEVVDEMANQPSEEPIATPTKSGFKKEQEDRLTKLTEAFKTLKK